MALTLVEAAKLALDAGETHRATVIETFARENDLLRVTPFMNIAGNAYSYNQENTLPGIAFRGLNEGYTESVGVVNPQTERLTIAGGDLDVDKAIVDMLGPGTRATHEAMKIKALGQKIGDRFVKGDSATTAKEFDGLQIRLVGDQLIENDGGTGAALSLANLDQAIDAVDNPTHLLMNKAMRRRLTTAARTTTIGGFISYGVDEFGRKIAQYAELPILIADRNQDQFTTLAFDEAAAGGGTSSTSIYVLQLGEGFLSGLQNGMMDVRDVGELETKPVLRTRVEWYVAPVLEHPRAAARLRGITDAAVVA